MRPTARSSNSIKLAQDLGCHSTAHAHSHKAVALSSKSRFLVKETSTLSRISAAATRLSIPAKQGLDSTTEHSRRRRPTILLQHHVRTWQITPRHPSFLDKKIQDTRSLSP